MVLRLSRPPLDLRPLAATLSDVQRQGCVAVAYHTGIAVERLVAAIRGAVAPPSADEAEAIAVKIAELHHKRFPGVF